MAKKFMYVCLGVLMLAVAAHLAVPVKLAQSQEGARPVLFGACQGSAGSQILVITDQGNLYKWGGGDNWTLQGSWPGIPPTSTQPATWSRTKAEFGE